MPISLTTANLPNSAEVIENNSTQQLAAQLHGVESGGIPSNMVQADLRSPPLPSPVEGVVVVKTGNDASSMENSTKSCCTRFKDFCKQLWGKVKENVTKAMNWANTKLTFSTLSGVARFFAGLGTALGGVVVALVGLALCSVYYGVAIVALVATGIAAIPAVLLAAGSNGTSGGGAVLLMLGAAVGAGGAVLASPIGCLAGGVIAVMAGIKNMVEAVRGSDKTSNQPKEAGVTV